MAERRLGVSIPTEDGLGPVPELVRLAERLGYTDAWSFEVNGSDAFTPLAAAAAVTESMRLGTGIVPVFTRPPGLIAMQAASLSDLSGGRFVLGLGSSTPVVVQQWFGVPFSKPLTRTREVALQVRALLEGDRVGGMRLAKPSSFPVPIWIAALGEGMLKLSAEIGDGVCFYMVGPKLLPHLLKLAGGTRESFARINVIPGEGEGVIALARRAVVSYALVPYYARVMAKQGFGEEIAAIQSRWKEGDRAGAPGQVSDAMLDELTLTGSADRIRQGIERYWAAGLTTPTLAVFGGADTANLLQELAPQ